MSIVMLSLYARAQSLEPAQWAEVVTGAKHACALDSYQSVTCWGELPDGVPPPQGTAFVALSAGLNHTCGLTDVGQVFCWGAIDHAPTSQRFTQLASADHYTCAHDDEPQLMHCFGQDVTPTDLADLEADRQARRPSCQINTSSQIRCQGDRRLRQEARGMVPQTPMPGHPRHPLTRAEAMLDRYGQGFAWWGPSVETIPWLELAEQASALAEALSGLEDSRAHEQRFRMLVLAGEMAYNSDETLGPHYQDVGKTTVNYHYYRAACMVMGQEALLSLVTSPEQQASVMFYFEQLKNGTLPTE